MTAAATAAREGRLLTGFVLVGAAGFCTDAGLLALGLSAGASPVVARAISLTIALHVTFLLNGILVFRGLSWEGLPRRWAGYMVANGFGAACNYLVFVGLTASRLPVVSERAPAFVGAAVAALLINFAGTRLLAFRVGIGGRSGP